MSFAERVASTSKNKAVISRSRFGAVLTMALLAVAHANFDNRTEANSPASHMIILNQNELSSGLIGQETEMSTENFVTEFDSVFQEGMESERFKKPQSPDPGRNFFGGFSFNTGDGTSISLSKHVTINNIDPITKRPFENHRTLHEIRTIVLTKNSIKTFPEFEQKTIVEVYEVVDNERINLFRNVDRISLESMETGDENYTLSFSETSELYNKLIREFIKYKNNSMPVRDVNALNGA